MKGIFSPAQRKILHHLREEGGVIERRRGNMGSRFWNNYWTSAIQPQHPAWYAQSHTIKSLVTHGALVVIANDKDGFTRCRLANSIADAPSTPAKPLSYQAQLAAMEEGAIKESFKDGSFQNV